MKVFVRNLVEEGDKQEFKSETIMVPGASPPFNKCEPPSVRDVENWLKEKQSKLDSPDKLTLLSLSRVN